VIVRKRVEDVAPGDWVVGRPQAPIPGGPFRCVRSKPNGSGGIQLQLTDGRHWVAWTQLRGALVDTRDEEVQ